LYTMSCFVYCWMLCKWIFIYCAAVLLADCIMHCTRSLHPLHAPTPDLRTVSTEMTACLVMSHVTNWPVLTAKQVEGYRYKTHEKCPYTAETRKVPQVMNERPRHSHLQKLGAYTWSVCRAGLVKASARRTLTQGLSPRFRTTMWHGGFFITCC